jgi:hypothetical protein
VVAWRFGARGGFQAATTPNCTPTVFAADVSACHAVAVQGLTTLGLFDRVRGEFGFEWLRPVLRQGAVQDRWNPLYGGGLQLLY